MKPSTKTILASSTLLMAGAAMLSFPSAALAQSESTAADEATMGDIVVTAQHREQRIQDVGIAISAISGEALRDAGITSSVQIARTMPGVFISQTAGGQSAQFSIRGVTQNDFSDGIEGPVAVYVDDTYSPALNAQTFGTFDLERVEVLKGPQGTLFGRNATGGLVHFVPNKPSKDPNGYLDVTYGRFNHVRVEGALGLPINDKVQMRISGVFNQFDPILKNIYPYGIGPASGGKIPPKPKCCEDGWNDDTLALRGQLQLEPTERLTIRASGAYYRTKMSENPYTSIATINVYDAQGRLVNTQVSSPTETRLNIGPGGINVDGTGQPTGQTRPIPGGDFNGFIAPDIDDRLVSKDWSLEKQNFLRSYDAALHINYDFDTVELVSITDYRRFSRSLGTDVDASPVNLINYVAQSRQHNISQEVRLASTGRPHFRWTLGAYYLNIKTRAQQSFQVPSNSLFAAQAFPAFAVTGIDLVDNTRFKTESISAFGQAEYDLSPQITAVVGGRIIHERVDFDFNSFAYLNSNDYVADDGPPLFPLLNPFNGHQSKVLWAGKAQLEYHPDRNLLVYAGINRGVKGGSFNVQLPDGSPSLAPSRIPYKPETLTSLEVGVKSTLLDGLLTFNTSAFYYFYNDYQAYTFANVGGTVSNQKTRTYGMEATASLRPSPELSIELAMSLVHARVKDLPIAPGVLKDVVPTFTPSKIFSAQVNYQVPTKVAGGDISFGADISWHGKVYGNIRNFDADVLPSYFLANGHIYWTSADTHYKFGVGVDNITDEKYNTVNFNLAGLCGCSEVSYATPRWWNVSARYSF